MSSPPDSGTFPRLSFDRKLGLFLLTACALLVATYLAVVQSPRPALSPPLETGSWAWWKWPVESNAFYKFILTTSEGVSPGAVMALVEDGRKVVHSDDFTVIVFSRDEAFGLALTLEGGILRSGDRGATWQAVAQGYQGWRSISIVPNGRKAFAVGKPGALLTSDDAGEHWETSSLPGSTARQVLFVDDNRGWVLTDHEILVTGNGGKSWETHSRKGAGGFEAFCVNRDGTGVLLGEEVFFTRDGFRTMQPVISPDSLTGVLCSPDSGPFFVYSGSALFKHEGEGRFRHVTNFDGAIRSPLQVDALGRMRFLVLSSGPNDFSATPYVSLNRGDDWVSPGLAEPHIIGIVRNHDHWLAISSLGRLYRSRDGLSWDYLADIGRESYGGIWKVAALETREGIVLYLQETSGISRVAIDREDRIGERIQLDEEMEGALALFDSSEEIVMCGGWCRFFNASGEVRKTALPIPMVPFAGGYDVVAKEWLFSEGKNLFRSAAFFLAGENINAVSQESTKPPEPKPVHVFPDNIRAIVIDGKRRVTVATANALYRSDGDLETWAETPVPITSGLGEEHGISDVFSPPDSDRVLVVAGGNRLLSWDGKQFRSLLDTGKHPEWNIVATAWGRDLVVGGQTYFWRSADGGATWEKSKYIQWPAPWFYVALLAGIGSMAAIIRTNRHGGPVEYTIAAAMVSDAPLEQWRGDALGFRERARGISMFLRNRATQAPLTLAITGPWGQGKSSFMNLIRLDLRENGYRPVWINAWHHQQEEQFLAAVLNALGAQIAPSWHTPFGLLYRGRLLLTGLRNLFQNSPLRLLLFLLVLLGSGVVFKHAEPDWTSIREVLREWSGFTGSESAGKKADKKEDATNDASTTGKDALVDQVVSRLEHHAVTVGSGTGLLATLSMLLIWVIQVLAGMKAHGLNPAMLLKGTPQDLRLSDLRQKSAIRELFAVRFADVTRALSPRTATILIDDLDRLTPAHLMQVLETVNFLVTSGRCYVLMALSRQPVEAAVGIALKEIVDETVTREGGNEEDKRQRRIAMAHHYLEKLINLEIPVPSMRAEQAGGILPGRGEASRCQGMAQVLRRGAMLALLLGGVAAVGWGVVQLDALLADWKKQTQAKPAPVAPTPKPDPGSEQKPKIETEPPGGTPGKSPFVTLDPALSKPVSPLPGEEVSTDRTLAWGGALFAIGLSSLLLYASYRRGRVEDSDDFHKACAEWLPTLLQVIPPTPRAIKRHINGMRLMAMLQRGTRPEVGWCERGASVWRRLRGLPPLAGAAAQAESAMTDPDLVALSVLSKSFPDYFRPQEAWGWLLDDSRREDADWLERRRKMIEQKQRHNAMFATDLDDHRQAFMALAREFRMM